MCPIGEIPKYMNLIQPYRNISLSGTEVTDENIKKLVKQCKNLTEIDLSWTPITSRAISDIISNLSHSIEKISVPQEIPFLQLLQASIRFFTKKSMNDATIFFISILTFKCPF